MTPILVDRYTVKEDIHAKWSFVANWVNQLTYNNLFEHTPWVNQEAPRNECFMSDKTRIYSYGKGFVRTYASVPFSNIVHQIMSDINKEYSTNYNVCFLNYYQDQFQHLGWHADDSPEMNPDHPIAVVSFGAERYIWCKEKDHTGSYQQQYLLKSGSLFIMPAGYQKNHVHRIPKHYCPCDGRISLTYRNFK